MCLLVIALWIAGFLGAIWFLRALNHNPTLKTWRWQTGFWFLVAASTADIFTTWWSLRFQPGRAAEMVPGSAAAMRIFGVLPGLIIVSLVVLGMVSLVGQRWGHSERLRHMVYVWAYIRGVLAVINGVQIIAVYAGVTV